MTIAELKRAVMQTNTFKLDNEFMLDIVCDAEREGATYEAWLWHKDYGIKELLFGLPYRDYEAFINTAIPVAEDAKIGYARKYIWEEQQ